MKKTIYPCLFLLSLALAIPSHATWVGIFLQRKLFNDHIHVTVSDDDDINNVMRFNIWQNEPVFHRTLKHEIKYASKFIIFHHEKDKDEITNEWKKLYYKISPKRSMLSKNCAYTTRQILSHILNIDIERSVVFARLALFTWQPYSNTGIELPGAIVKQLRKTLQKNDIPFFTKKTLPKDFM